MSDATDQIRNLIHRYSACFDEGRLADLADLFEHATLKFALGTGPAQRSMPGSAFKDMSSDSVIIYADGTPRTRHLVTNTIIEVDEAAGRATARSYNTTLQQAPGHPLEIIATATYEDAFERVGETWRFSERLIRTSSIDGVTRDFIGDMSRHVSAATASGTGPPGPDEPADGGGE